MSVALGLTAHLADCKIKLVESRVKFCQAKAKVVGTHRDFAVIALLGATEASQEPWAPMKGAFDEKAAFQFFVKVDEARCTSNLCGY